MQSNSHPLTLEFNSHSPQPLSPFAAAQVFSGLDAAFLLCSSISRYPTVTVQAGVGTSTRAMGDLKAGTLTSACGWGTY